VKKRFVAWMGLLGAVPIAMAIQACASPVPEGKLMPPFALVVVLFGLLLQGFALVPIAHRLGLVLPSDEPEPT
jgi:CPA1 family monovalent cation:H+ antiporter/cell volume regulation protein A